MSRVRLTKNELKKQKDSLKRFVRYLPMLILKKKQLQLEILKVLREIKSLAVQADNLRATVMSWADVFGQEFPINDHLRLKQINTKEGNVAGIDLPVFLGLEFAEAPYNYMASPLWVDKGIESLKRMLELKAKLLILHKQVEVLKEELRITTQRVNLFERTHTDN